MSEGEEKEKEYNCPGCQAWKNKDSHVVDFFSMPLEIYEGFKKACKELQDEFPGEDDDVLAGHLIVRGINAVHEEKVRKQILQKIIDSM